MFNVIYRAFAKWGFNDRTTFPFYFSPWYPGETWTQLAIRLAHMPAFWGSTAVVLLFCTLLFLTCRWILDGSLTGKKTALALVYLVLLGIALPLAYESVPKGVQDLQLERGSFLSLWLDSGNTMLYSMPLVQRKGYFLRHFEELQPQLKRTIHGADHPPGATLALFWLGRMAGAHEQVGRDRLRYALATTVFASCSAISMFFLGSWLFGSRKTGLLSAAVWIAKPSTLAYNPFAPDTVYWVFFILWLALTWKVVTAERRPWGSLIFMGVVLAVMTLLNFNWPLFGAIFGGFLSLYAWRYRWTLSEWFWRAAIPSGVGLGLLIWICVKYKLDYLAIYRYGMEACKYYNIRGAYQWITTLIGGQLDLFILMGSLTAYLFFRNLVNRLRERPLAPATLFLLTLLAFYGLAVLLMDPLKIETSRIWAWVPSLFIVLVVRDLESSPHFRFYLFAVLMLSFLQYYAMRLMLVSCG